MQRPVLHTLSKYTQRPSGDANGFSVTCSVLVSGCAFLPSESTIQSWGVPDVADVYTMRPSGSQVIPPVPSALAGSPVIRRHSERAGAAATSMAAVVSFWTVAGESPSAERLTPKFEFRLFFSCVRLPPG